MNHYMRLRTTTRELIEIGTRIQQSGTPDFGNPMKPIIGAITKMQECDSGIFLFVKTDDGNIEKAHVRFDVTYGIRMNECGIVTTILQPAPRQLEINA
ncbi:hypothetical protein KDM87_06985 [Undibacterium sp. FT147W]|uniref:Nitrogen fixation protein NifZ n=1 Tax=Undibacterium rivi TaxID=2828729 RepID=A0ABS5H0V4_9BURK|nr:hypothetical protein [Undibacterium rivi]MBR7792341.1 hypothetical protein [Undibacterium rivi]